MVGRAVDTEGLARWSAPVADPTVLRAEFPDAGGNLSGQVLAHLSAEALVVVPDDPAIAEVRLYRPGQGVTRTGLELVGAFPLG